MENEDLIIEQELEKIGSRIKQLRKKKGYTSAEKFAFKHDIDRAQYGRYERGGKDMRLSSLIRILDALEVDWKEFFNKDFQKLMSVGKRKK